MRIENILLRRLRYASAVLTIMFFGIVLTVLKDLESPNSNLSYVKVTDTNHTYIELQSVTRIDLYSVSFMEKNRRECNFNYNSRLSIYGVITAQYILPCSNWVGKVKVRSDGRMYVVNVI